MRMARQGSAAIISAALILPAHPASAAVGAAVTAKSAAEPVPATTGTEAATAKVDARAGLNREGLQRSLDAIIEAGMYGTYSQVRDGDKSWQGASGVADIRTQRPVTPRMEHRIGSTTKTFVATAILQQVDQGRINLDAPIAEYLPDLVPGERGRKITVRMLLNHTSGIGDYMPAAFPSTAMGPKPGVEKSYDDNRFRNWRPQELVKLGLGAPPTGEPGAEWSYSNTNYIIAGLLLEKVTGTSAERYIERHVIAKAGLKHTYFPRTPYIVGPHSKAYVSFFGAIDPPRDYSVYNMSMAWTAGALVSTMKDVNQFFRALLTGRLISPEQLKQMQTIVPVPGPGTSNGAVAYGLGIQARDLPCGRFWGHPGGVFGMSTESLSSPDGRRQITMGLNLSLYRRLGKNGQPKPHPIDDAFQKHLLAAACGSTTSTT